MNPTYDLGQIRILVGCGAYYITVAAANDAAQLGMDDEDIVECVANCLNESHFYKTMQAEKMPGLWQDVYKIAHQGYRLYIKLQINAAQKAVVISFKEDTSVIW